METTMTPRHEFTEGEKAVIRDEAFGASREVIKAHIDSCPIGKNVRASLNQLKGAVAVLVVVLGFFGVTTWSTLQNLVSGQKTSQTGVDKETTRLIAHEALMELQRQQRQGDANLLASKTP